MSPEIQFRKLRNNSYPLVLVVAWFLYLLFQLTPSSFGIVRMEFGLTDGNIFGTSQPVRSDEYSTWTPEIVSETLYGSKSLNRISPYSESIEPIYPLPNLKLKSFFQPFYIGFHLFSNSLGLSFFWGTLIFGSLLSSYYLGRKLFKSVSASITFSILLFANSFQQTWLTVLGVNSLLFPIIANLIIIKSRPLINSIFCIYLGTSLILTSPYLAGIPALNILLIVVILLLAKNIREVKVLLQNFLFLFAGELFGILLYMDKWRIFSNSSYPGNRPKSGGGLTLIQLITQFFPNLQYRGWTDLLKLNQSESASYGTVLPVVTFLLVLKVIVLRIPIEHNSLEAKKTIGLGLVYLIFSFWQISVWFNFIGDLTFVSRSGEQRLFSLTGPILIILCVRLLVNHNLKKFLTIKLLIISASIIGILGFIFQNLKEPQSFYFTKNLKWNFFYFDDFLFLIFLILILLVIRTISFFMKAHRNQVNLNHFIVLLISASLVNITLWIPFNPLLPAKKIYELTETQAAQDFTNLRSRYSKPIIFPSFSKIQNGWIQLVAPNTFQRILPIPVLDYWQSILTPDDFSAYKEILNRYLYITISDDISTPKLLFLDHLQLPSSWFNKLSIAPRFIISSDNVMNVDIYANFDSCNLVNTNFFKFTGSAIVENKPNNYNRVIDGFLDSDNLNSYEIGLSSKHSSSSMLVKAQRSTSLRSFPHRNPEARLTFFQLVIKQRNANDCSQIYFKPIV